MHRRFCAKQPSTVAYQQIKLSQLRYCFFLKISADQLWHLSDCRLRKLYLRKTFLKNIIIFSLWPWLNLFIKN